MTKRNICSIILLLVLTLTACAPPAPQPTATPLPTSTTQIPTLTAVPSPVPTPDDMATLTSEEKVGQLFIVGFEGTTPAEDVTHALQDLQVGGVILFGRNVASATQLVELTNALKALNQSALPLFISVDQEGGLVERMPPELARLPNAYDVESPAALGKAVAQECLAFGFNMDFAPSLDIWSNPENTVIGRRAFADNWEAVADKGPVAAYAMMEAGIIPVVKHFPGHGDTAMDSHVGLPTVDKTLEELQNDELVPFWQAINGASSVNWAPRGPVPAVMVAHILMTQLDAERPASLSPSVVTDLLRGTMGFDGVVFTDDMTMGAITQNYGLGEACVLAIEAGCDVLLVCHKQRNVDAAYDAVLEAVRAGRISQARLDESVRRVLDLKAAYALTDAPIPPADVTALNAMVGQVKG